MPRISFTTALPTIGALAITLLPTVCVAAQLHITDCDGVTKVMFDAEGEALHRVELVLADGSPYANSAIKIPMTNGDTGKVFERGPVGNVIAYEEIAAGEWKLCPIPTDLALKDVRVIPTSQSSSAGIAPVALGVAALAAGGVAAADSGSSGGSSDSAINAGPLAPLEDSGGLPPTTTELASNNSSGVSDKNSKGCGSPNQLSAQIENGCRVGEEPAPISPFS